MSSVRSQSSQQRQYSEYHLANRRHDDSSFAAGMPSATSADDEPFGDDFQAIPSSVSEVKALTLYLIVSVAHLSFVWTESQGVE